MSTDNIKWAEDAIAAKKEKILENRAENARLEAEIPDLEAYIRVEKAKAEAPNTVVGALGRAAMSPTAQNVRVSAEVKDLIDAGTRGAKKRAILSMLDAFNGPMSTSTVIMTLPAYGITNATTENTSPQLSAYKADGLVALVFEGWKITQKGREYLAQKN